MKTSNFSLRHSYAKEGHFYTLFNHSETSKFQLGLTLHMLTDTVCGAQLSTTENLDFLLQYIGD